MAMSIGNYEAQARLTALLLKDTGSYYTGFLPGNVTSNILYQLPDTPGGGLLFATPPTAGIANMYWRSDPDNSDVDLSLYAYLPGRFGGQQLFGGTGESEELILNSTASDSKGRIIIGGDSFSPLLELNESTLSARLTTPLSIENNLAVGGNSLLAGYLSVGSALAPLNVGVGDVTARRLNLGIDTAFSSVGPLGTLLQLVGSYTAASNALGLMLSNSFATFPTVGQSILDASTLTVTPNGSQTAGTATGRATTVSVVGGTIGNVTGQSISVITTGSVTGTVKGLSINHSAASGQTDANYTGLDVAFGTVSITTLGQGASLAATANGGAGNLRGLNIQSVNTGGSGNVTGILINNVQATGGTAESVGLDINAPSGGLLNLGIRNASGLRQTGPSSLFGSSVAPSVLTNGWFGATGAYIGQNLGPLSGTILQVLGTDDALALNIPGAATVDQAKDTSAGVIGTLAAFIVTARDKSASGTQSGQITGSRSLLNHSGAGILTTGVAAEFGVNQGASAGAVTTLYAARVLAPVFGATPGTVTTMAGLRIDDQGNAAVTTSIGLDIAAQSASGTFLGIRNASNSRQTGYMSVMGAAAPTNTGDGIFSSKAIAIVTNGGVTLQQIDDNAWDSTLTFTPRTDWANTGNGASVAIKGGIGAIAGINQDIRGLYVQMDDQTSSGTHARSTAIRMRLNKSGASTTTNIHAFSGFIAVSGGLVTTAATMRVFSPSITAGKTVTTFAGLWIEGHGTADVTNAIGLQIDAQANATGLNVGIRNDDGRANWKSVVVPANPPAGYITQFSFAKTAGNLDDTPRFLGTAGHDSGVIMRGRNLFPVPVTPYTSAKVAFTPTTILGCVGLVTVEAPITLATVAFNVSTASVGATGALRICVYTETGVKLTSTDTAQAGGTVNALGINIITLAASQYLPAGRYYVFMCQAAAYVTTQPAISCFTQDNTFQAVAGQEIICGTVVCTAGAAPAPLGAITSTDNRTPMFKFYGTAV